jgi:phage host-nuclease inhibitor protein Gam
MSARKTNAISVPQDREQAAATLADYGATLRGLDRLEAEMNDAIAEVKISFARHAAPFRAKAEKLENVLKMFCEANRRLLTDDNRTKTADLGVGKASWRWQPAKVTLRGKEESLVKFIQGSTDPELLKFLRATFEIDRVAMLRNPNLAKTLDGVEINEGVEAFEIKPDSAKIPETEVAEAAE